MFYVRHVMLYGYTGKACVVMDDVKGVWNAERKVVRWACKCHPRIWFKKSGGKEQTWD